MGALGTHHDGNLAILFLTGFIMTKEVGTVSETVGAKAVQFETVKQITKNVIKFNATPTIIKILSPIYIGEKLEGGTAAQKAMLPPHMAEAIDMATGEVGLIIFGKVLLGEIEKHYPKESYVDKYFSIAKKAPPEGDRKYSLWEVLEVKPKG